MTRIPQLAAVSLGTVLACVAMGAHAQSAQRHAYVVQLVDAPIASYEGTIPGLAATKPAAGSKLDMASQRVRAYAAYLDGRVTIATAKVPNAPISYRYGVVLNGFAAQLTDAEVAALRADPGVARITRDEGMKLDTSYTTSQFLGLGAPGGAWSRTDSQGRAIKGENVIIAMVDSGVWPENVSVSDKVDANGKPVPSHMPGTVVYDPLPAGRYRGTCEAGQAFTAAMCNNKLIGAQAFQATFLANRTIWPGEYLGPRDEDGHGSHTLTTAGGNANSPVTVSGASFEITGVAPRARLAAYKVCNSFITTTGTRDNTCFFGDSVAAINKAVADGVDVINFSIGGFGDRVNDIVAQAMLGAAKAGVFVSASAGNSGPGNTVAHVSPWVATVGNSTHDRYTEATVTLGNGATARGGSWQTAGLPSAPIIMSTDAGVTPFANLTTNADRLALARCYNAADRTSLGGSAAAAIDPAKVAGKILVCARGGNVFVNKADVAASAGAVGVIFQNITAAYANLGGPSANTVLALALPLPAVHLPASTEGTVIPYVTGGGSPTASFAGATPVAGVVAPQMAGTSSRGPNRFDANVLKPDITAPGSDIIAGYSVSLTADQRAALVAGTAVGPQGAALLSGTSMSAPHVAGAAALLKQVNPTWSPAAIKSALMTSAEQSVKLSNGNADPDRWGYGAGHLDPNDALSTTVVYDISNASYDAYVARTLNGRDLNLPSITFGNVLGTESTTRTLKNNGSTEITLSATSALSGFDVTVEPSSLTIPAGGTATYQVRVARQAATPFGAYRFGHVTWTGGGQSLRTPLTARAMALVAYTTVNDNRASGSRLFTVGTGFSGPMAIVSSGMVPATQRTGTVAQSAETCFATTVATGGLALRAQLFANETAAPDVDLLIRNSAGTQVGLSESATSSELIQLSAPAAGTYSVCVVGYDTGSSPSASFTLHTWVVGAPSGPQTLRGAGPSTAVLGGTASVVGAWNVTPGQRYLGVMTHRQSTTGPVLGATAVFVDAATSTTRDQALAEVVRHKPAR